MLWSRDLGESLQGPSELDTYLFFYVFEEIIGRLLLSNASSFVQSPGNVRRA